MLGASNSNFEGLRPPWPPNDFRGQIWHQKSTHGHQWPIIPCLSSLWIPLRPKWHARGQMAPPDQPLKYWKSDIADELRGIRHLKCYSICNSTPPCCRLSCHASYESMVNVVFLAWALPLYVSNSYTQTGLEEWEPVGVVECRFTC